MWWWWWWWWWWGVVVVVVIVKAAAHSGPEHMRSCDGPPKVLVPIAYLELAVACERAWFVVFLMAKDPVATVVVIGDW